MSLLDNVDDLIQETNIQELKFPKPNNYTESEWDGIEYTWDTPYLAIFNSLFNTWNVESNSNKIQLISIISRARYEYEQQCYVHKIGTKIQIINKDGFQSTQTIFFDTGLESYVEYSAIRNTYNIIKLFKNNEYIKVLIELINYQLYLNVFGNGKYYNDQFNIVFVDKNGLVIDLWRNLICYKSNIQELVQFFDNYINNKYTIVKYEYPR